MDSSAQSDIKIEVNDVNESSDDTDYEVSNDCYSELDPEVLKVHLDCSSEVGKSVLSVAKDVEIIEEKYQETNRDRHYDSSKYFHKAKAVSSRSVSEFKTSHSEIHAKKIKMDSDKEEVIIISSDDEENVLAEVDVPKRDEATERKPDEIVTVDRQDDLGFRDREQLSKLKKVRRWKYTGLGTAVLSGEKVIQRCC